MTGPAASGAVGGGSQEREVLAANSRFYAAFESGDLDAMHEVWVADGHAVCVHPGWSPVIGAAAVRRSWAVVMAHTPYIQFILTDVAVVVAADVASVTCTENVLAAADLGRGGGAGQGFAGGKAVTTNVFRRGRNGWRLWIHHASPVLSAAAAGDEGAR
ncbi:MAG: nuclear transport factor 2 family protein [Actinomycetota bacterium]|nr:nuclear transport factor 2 family protein [Actinomycetota bacterium]